MECNDFKQLLSQFLEHELTAEREESLKQHLAQCEACSRTLASLQEMVGIMHRMNDAGPQPPADFLEKINTRLDATGWWSQLRERLGSWPIMQRPYPAIIVTATFVLALVLTKQAGIYGPNKGNQLTDSDTSPSRPVKTQLAKLEETDQMIMPEEAKESQFKRKQAARTRTEVTPSVGYTLSGNMEIAAGDPNLRLAKDCSGGICEYRMAQAPVVLPANRSGRIVLDEKLKEVSRFEIVDAKPSNLIARNRWQNWILTVNYPIRDAATDVEAIVEQVKAKNVQQGEGTTAVETARTFSFSVRYGQLSMIIKRIENIGKLERLTGMPSPRPDAYVGPRGLVNPQVLEERIDVELTIVR